MPKEVVENKNKAYLTSAIITTVITLIPVGIIAIIAGKNPSVWSAPFPSFILYYLIIHTFFAFGVGYVGQMNKTVYIILGSIALIGMIALLIMGYVNGNPVIMHLASATLLTAVFYTESDKGGDNYYFRYATPVIIILASLITVLLLVGIKMSVTAHGVIVTIFNLIFGITCIVRIKNEIKTGFEFIEDTEVTYSQETDEEIAERKALKKEEIAERKALKKEESEFSKKHEVKKVTKTKKNKNAMPDEEREKYVRKFGENALFAIDSWSINNIFEYLEDEANRVIGNFNTHITMNNYTIRNIDDSDKVEAAIKSNKLIKSKISKHRHIVKSFYKNLKKLENKTFTIDDFNKKFLFKPWNGGFKIKPYDGSEDYIPIKVYVLSYTVTYDIGLGITTVEFYFNPSGMWSIHLKQIN